MTGSAHIALVEADTGHTVAAAAQMSGQPMLGYTLSCHETLTLNSCSMKGCLFAQSGSMAVKSIPEDFPEEHT